MAATAEAPTRTDAIEKILRRTKHGFTAEQIRERLPKHGRPAEQETGKRVSATLHAMKKRGVLAIDEQRRWTITS